MTKSFDFDMLDEIAAVPPDVTRDEIAEEEAQGALYKWGRPGNMTPFRTSAERETFAYFLEEHRAGGVRVEHLVANSDLLRQYRPALKKRHLVAWFNELGEVGVWPITTAKGNNYQVDGEEAFSMANDRWTMVNAKDNFGGLHVLPCGKGYKPDPEWPEDLPNILSLAGRALGTDRVILNADHPLIKRIPVIAVGDKEDAE